MNDELIKTQNRHGRAQVLLCGSRYGQSYLSAIFESDNLELAALLARGSDRSVRLSEQCGVPLYQAVDAIDCPLDLACVAVGGQAGVDIALALLHKAVPVLIEHPIGGDDMSQLLAAAAAEQVPCHINSHFPEMPPVVDFVQRAKQLNAQGAPLVISLSCNTRTLFSMLDVLMQAFSAKAVEGFEFDALGDGDLYQSCRFRLNGIACQMLYQHWRGSEDDSRDSPLGHQITVTYPQGVLQLAGTFGPCLWFPLIATDYSRAAPVYENSAARPGEESVDTVLQWRSQANRQAMLRALQDDGEKSTAYTDSAYVQTLCRTWQSLFEALGVTVVDVNALSVRD